MNSILCQNYLPRSKTDEKQMLISCGSSWIYLQSGILEEDGNLVKQPLPYGSLARLILLYISKCAVKKHSRKIILGCRSEILKKIGKKINGENYSKLMQQIKSISVLRMQIGVRYEKINFSEMNSFEFIEYFSENKNKKCFNGKFFPSEIILSENYYNSLINHAVPLNEMDILSISSSSLAIDVYMWLAYRLYRVEKSIFFSWEKILQHFAPEYKDKKDFRKKFITALSHVRQVYPAAQVDVIRGGIVLHQSPPPISLKTAALIDKSPQNETPIILTNQ
jgi:hypothetical protein